MSGTHSTGIGTQLCQHSSSGGGACNTYVCLCQSKNPLAHHLTASSALCPPAPSHTHNPTHKPTQATEDLLRLREALDSQSFATPLMQLQQRTWLMHWALHVFWNTEAGKSALIDLFLQPAYMSAIQVGGLPGEGGGGLVGAFIRVTCKTAGTVTHTSWHSTAHGSTAVQPWSLCLVHVHVHVYD